MRARAGRGYRVQVDVQRYFASVDHAVLLGRLRHRIADTRLLSVLDALIAHGGDEPGRGMPIGSLTSQLFAKVYLDALDHFVKEELRVRHYLRYMDDVLLLADDRREARDRLGALRAFLTEVAVQDRTAARTTSSTATPVTARHFAARLVHRLHSDVVEHFEKWCDALDGKAMIVCMSRRICVELYRELVKLRPAWRDEDDELATRRRKNVVQARSFAEMLEQPSAAGALRCGGFFD